MSLHPDNRPRTVAIFRDALFGKQEVPVSPKLHNSSFEVPNLVIFPQEQIAGYILAGLFLIGLIATVAR